VDGVQKDGALNYDSYPHEKVTVSELPIGCQVQFHVILRFRFGLNVFQHDGVLCPEDGPIKLPVPQHVLEGELSQAVLAAADAAKIHYLSAYPRDQAKDNPYATHSNGQIHAMHYQEHQVDLGSMVVQRPNHGLAYALRKAALVPHVAAAYRIEYGQYESTTDLGSFDFEFAVLRAMMQGMVYSVAGRKSEAGFRDDKGAYLKYKQDSINLFTEFANSQSVQPWIRDMVATALMDAFTLPPSAIKRVLEVSHDLDLMRCTGTGGMKSRIRELEKDIGIVAAAELAERAEAAILATGDRLWYSHSSTGYRASYDPDTFTACSVDPARCWELATGMASIAVPNPIVLVPGELAFDGSKFNFEGGFNAADAKPLRFVGASFKKQHEAINQMWKATDWSDRSNVREQRALVLKCLETTLVEFAKIQPGVDAVGAYYKLRAASEDSTATGTTADMMVKLWSNPEIKELGRRELCFILATVIREDDARTPVHERPSKLFESAVTLVCMLQVHLNSARRYGLDSPLRWPRGKDGTGDEKSTKEHTTYRGGGLPAEHIPFYEKMMKDGLYSRVPAPLPTSFLRQTAIMFRKRAENMGHRGVIWEVKLKDPDLDDGGCMQVNYLEKSLQAHEREFLFSAYSAFKVLSMVCSGTFTQITLEAARDNRDVPEDVPSAPWI